MGEIREIKTAKTDATESVRNCLSDLEEILDDSPVNGIAIVLTMADGSVGHCYSNDVNVYQLIGGLEDIKFRIMSEQVEY